MRQRIRFSDFTTRSIGRLCSNALSDIWCDPHLDLRRPTRLLSFVLALILAAPLLAQTNAPAPDDGTALFEMRPRQYLFGDWGGKRTALEEKGIKFDLFYTADLRPIRAAACSRQKPGGRESAERSTLISTS